MNNFVWVKDIYKFGEIFIKSSNEESDKGYFFQVDVQYPEKLYDFIHDFPFLPERMNIEKV